MLHIDNNTKMNFLLEALPLDAAAEVGNIITHAIQTANEDWPNDWTPEKIGDLTVKEFETFLVEQIGDLTVKEFETFLVEQIGDDEEEYFLDNEIRFDRFADILSENTFRDTMLGANI